MRDIKKENHINFILKNMLLEIENHNKNYNYDDIKKYNKKKKIILIYEMY